MPIIEIPWQRLSEEALLGLMEEFISREGTDYGWQELSLEDKVSRLRRQVENQEVLIIFDEDSETCQLINREDRPSFV